VSQTYLHRSIEPALRKAAAEFPAVMLTGPRQAGKTTLLKHVFGESCGYVSLETPDIRDAATRDPRGFLEMHPPPVIFDEVQHAPGLLPYVKERIDADRGRAGQYLVTGSQNLLLAEHVSESLAGRAAVLRLLPFSRGEAERCREEIFPWEDNSQRESPEPLAHGPLWESLLRGWYPELVAQPARDIQLWHASYVQTYLERDVRSLRQVGDLSQFQSFLRALAARTGHLLNVTDLARDLGVAVNTIKAWLSVLEATHQITVLRPYFANVGKRLVKTPKVYFTDTGTLCYLAGLRDPLHAASGPMGGPILEAAVLAEIVKTFAHRGMVPQVYFWRTSAGVEVDFLVEWGGRLVPIEVKLSATPRPAMAASIEAFRKDLGELALPGYVVHSGDIDLPLGEGVKALPFGRL
jgi:uncharacterized protein